MVSVDVNEFSANSPLDYAELNKLVLAIKTLASAMPVVTTSAPGSTKTPDAANANSFPSLISGYFSAQDAAPFTTSTKTGTPYTVTYMSNGVPVTFASPPNVYAWAGTANSSSGLAIVNRAGTPGNTSFSIKVGWAGRTVKGNVGIYYLAIGTVVKS